ncbi:MAG: hypothetical protein U0457_08605 [Candidatus Sericytochromatia bacterium]
MKKINILVLSSTLFFISCFNDYTPIIEKIPEKINILSKIQPKMEYPYDIEVTKDGKTIYFKNWYNYPKENDKYLDEKIPEQYEKIIKRKVIFKLDVETKKIEILKINNDSLIYNELGEEMELDTDGNLYINVLNSYINNFRYRENNIKNYIYKISPKGNILNKYDVFENDYNKYPVENTTNSLFYSFDGPINLVFENDRIFYCMLLYSKEILSDSFYLIKKLELSKNKISDFFKSKNGIKYHPFYVNNNLIFNSLGWTQANIYNVNTNKVISNNDTKWENIDLKNIDKSNNNKLSNEYNFVNNSIKINSKNEIFSTGIDVIQKHNIENKTINIIGSYPYGLKDGKSTEASFDYPSSLSIDGNDNIYVADTGNNAIRKITPNGVVSTFYKENS